MMLLKKKKKTSTFIPLPKDPFIYLLQRRKEAWLVHKASFPSTPLLPLLHALVWQQQAWCQPENLPVHGNFLTRALCPPLPCPHLTGLFCSSLPGKSDTEKKKKKTKLATFWLFLLSVTLLHRYSLLSCVCLCCLPLFLMVYELSR